MVVSKIDRRRAALRASALPDDRLVAASALAALTILLLMLLAGAAAADTAPGCQARTCSTMATANSGGAVPYFPGNTHYTPVRLSRAAPAK